MGKSKPRNRQKNRADPTAKQAKPPTDPELAALREQRILPVLKDLQSAESKTRSAAASAIANIIEDEKCRKLLLREQIVRILFEQTLTDSSLDTRTAGWGILRNLALEEEADFCIHLYRQDILTAIDGVVKTIIQTLESQETPLSKLPKPQQTLLWNLTTSIINLISSLSEAQEEILEALSKKSTVVNFLFGLLMLESTPTDVVNEVLSCLTALTEDNRPLVQQISENGDWLKTLGQIKDSGGLKAVAACGVLHNIFACMQWFDHNAPMEGASDASLIPVLVQAMEAPAKMNGINGSEGQNSSPDQILQLALEITASIASGLQEALEHGAKNEKPFEGFDDAVEDLSSAEEGMDIKMGDEQSDDEGAAGEDDDDEEGDEMTQEEIEADMELVIGDGAEEEDGEIEEITLDRLIRSAAPKVILFARPTPTENPIQSYALSTLNNIAWTIGSIDFSSGHLSSLQRFWSTLAQQIWDQIVSPVLASNTADIELASTVTSLAWAVARSVKGVVNIKPEEQRKFMALYQASKGLVVTEEAAAAAAANGPAKKSSDEQPDAFQSLGVKCIGVLGSLAMDPAPVELNREIGIFLITTLSSLPETPPADMVEALNQIFDIYADREFAFDEAVFWGDGLYKHLEAVQPKAKKMAKSIDKRKFGELRLRADEAVLNLGRFLVYKRKERAAAASAE